MSKSKSTQLNHPDVYTYGLTCLFQGGAGGGLPVGHLQAREAPPVIDEAAHTRHCHITHSPVPVHGKLERDMRNKSKCIAAFKIFYLNVYEIILLVLFDFAM